MLIWGEAQFRAFARYGLNFVLFSIGAVTEGDGVRLRGSNCRENVFTEKRRSIFRPIRFTLPATKG